MIGSAMTGRRLTSTGFGILGCCLLLAGCNTLSSLGLPVGGNQNALISPAKAISEAPGESLLLPRELAKETLPGYFIEVGDTILIEPVKFDATIRLAGDQVVKPDGFISLGEFGRLYAANKSIEQIQTEAQSMIDAQLRQELQSAHAADVAERKNATAGPKDAEELRLQAVREREDLVALERKIQEAIRNNVVSARLVGWESKKIYVLGEVNSPGSFDFIGNETALDAIIEAGGMTSRANRHHIIVARPTPCNSGRIVMRICYDQIVQLGDASTNYQLRPGDRVFVPSLTFREDLKQLFNSGAGERCPRCADCQTAMPLPTGCE